MSNGMAAEAKTPAVPEMEKLRSTSGSHSTNGVAAIHITLLRTVTVIHRRVRGADLGGEAMSDTLDHSSGETDAQAGDGWSVSARRPR
jgi:hypothetical protein